ncbi:unnamed protein product [Brassicogethes aeneus]|uniref:Uncharacterized protein n=1 Tax=Brassicogethes aeneus TaxID=1431903 RepID=A0A9P0ASC6_BRAAE|nr:unnamed protein product [Brassicogethes aeneus]
MTIILYYIPLSPPARAVLMTAEILGIDIEKREVDLSSGEHLSEEYRTLNPQHTVPTLVDGETVIWDSHAIIAYLVRKYGKNDSLYPKDYSIRALVDQRLHFEGSVVFISVRQIVRSMFFKGCKSISEEHRLNAYEALDFLDKFLKGKKFAAGDNLTLADISLVSSISSLNVIIPIDRQKFTNVARWFDEVSALPFYKANVEGLNDFKVFMTGLMS